MTLECFRYEDLVRGADLRAEAGRAFGHQGLGIVVVTGVPDIADARRELFALGQKFAALPEETRARYEHAPSSFSFGWSHGKETLEAGRPDLAKGSFYANPCFDAPFGPASDNDSNGSSNSNRDNDSEVGINSHDDDGGASGGPGVDEAAEAEAAAAAAAAAAVQRYPSFAHPNIWPDEDVPGFSAAFKRLGRAVVRVGELVARQCDGYVSTVHPGYEEGKMSRIVSSSRCPKGRLLHYFPRSSAPPVEKAGGGGGDGRTGRAAETAVDARDGSGGGGGGDGGTRGAAGAKAAGGDGDDADGAIGGEDDGAYSDWCGWHHDHSSLTGLVPAMFLDDTGREVANEDRRCGLYIRSRQKGALVKATLPPGESASTCLLFQIGETTQVLSGGALQATPHAVRSSSQEGVSREAFAVFMQPEWGESMDVPRGAGLESARSLHAKSLLPREAAPITDRLRPGMDFGEFTEATFAAYY